MDPQDYFQQALASNQSVLKRLKGLSLTLSMARLGVFLLSGFILYLFWGNSVVVASTLIVGIASFLFLVSRYADIKNKRIYHQKLQELNQKELKALGGDYSDFESGLEFLSSAHPFNQDIDLFGEGSLFQRMNRCGTLAGKKKLADILNSNDILNVEAKQKAIQELSQQPDWRQAYQLTASMIENEVDTERVVGWMKRYQSVIPKIFSVLPLLYLTLSIVIIALYGVGYVSGSLVLYVYLGGLGISGLYLKKINQLYADAGKMRETFMQYSKLLQMIETQNFSAARLKELQDQLATTGDNASVVLSKLSKEINSLDQRNNIFFALLANGFLLWDLKYAYRIEKWMKENEAIIGDWFSVIATFDALNSLSNYAFIHPQHIYPGISSSTYITAEELGHPLLDPSKRIDNTIEISEGNFFIITGANMAGKSTFLRTVALNLVMANCGLPVCAKSYTYQPIKLISSMRTSDSLKDDESYFFSELKRLKYIVDQISSDTYFIILDEILKGTNSKDKAEGSQKFVERLVKSKSTGLIATHDLSLCSIAEQSEQVQNYYFDAQIVNDELYFDYRFKKGVCQNMNASFLLNKMGIV